MELRIPKEFSIFGKTIKVSQPWRVDKQDSRGEWAFLKSSIRIKRNMPIDEKEVVFLHELTHAILDNLEYNDLSNDEEFMERFSRALHQALKSGK
jgi:hypothetical protein